MAANTDSRKRLAIHITVSSEGSRAIEMPSDEGSRAGETMPAPSAPSSSLRASRVEPRRHPFDDVVDRLRFADISDAVIFVRCFEDHSTGTDAKRFVVLNGLERTLLDDHQLLFRMAMTGMRRFSWVQRRHVRREAVERRRRGIEALPACA